MSTRFIPPQTPTSEEYWAGARRGELLYQSCSDCGAHNFPPRAHCGTCGSSELSWKTASGKGTVYTYTVSHRAPHPVFSDSCPLVIAVVELEEGPRMMTNIVDCDPESVSVGMSVQVTFEGIDDSEVVLPLFKPSDQAN